MSAGPGQGGTASGSSTSPLDVAEVVSWCREHLGTPPTQELFRSGHLSSVIGLGLADGREVVLKVRPASPRLLGCHVVQQRLFASGYPCPQPLVGPTPLGGGIATAESHVPGGDGAPQGGHAGRLSARAFARLIELAPAPAEVPSLQPAPSWAAWDHSDGNLWPRLEGVEIDLDTVDGPQWLDRAARRARHRLRVGRGAPVVGHCDWLTENVRWNGTRLLVVRDWDSAVADDEAVLVGFAAALYAPVGTTSPTPVAHTEDFLAAYRALRPGALTDDDLQRAWAAGLWTRAVDAKEQHAVGQHVTALSEAEARDRLARAGTG